MQDDLCQASYGNHSVAILGAGRLFDVNLPTITKSFPSIRLIDADPKCQPTWKSTQAKFPKNTFSFEVRDVTGALESWSRSFSLLTLNSFEQACQTLRDWHVAHPVPQSPLLPACEAVISLNLMSQIPLVWQRIVEKDFCRRFGKSFLLQNEESWLQALIPSAQSLLFAHGLQLVQSSTADILVISDVEYLHYRAPGRHKFQTLPFELLPTSPSTESRWKKITTTPRVSAESFSALFGLSLDSSTDLAALFPGCIVHERSEWLWHIAPLGIEKKDFGEINRVVALHLRRDDSLTRVK